MVPLSANEVQFPVYTIRTLWFVSAAWKAMLWLAWSDLRAEVRSAFSSGVLPPLGGSAMILTLDRKGFV